MTRHDHACEELLGAYALDAVDDDERAAVEAHLPTARGAGPRSTTTARSPPTSPSPAPPPPTGCGTASPSHRRRAAAAAAPGRRRRCRAGGHGPAARRGGSVTGRRRLAAAAAVIAASASSVAGVRQQRRDRRHGAGAEPRRPSPTMPSPSPDARIAELASTDGEVLARAAVLPDGDGLRAGRGPARPRRAHLPAVGRPAGERVVSLGPIGAAPDVVRVPRRPGPTTLMITAEDEPVAQTSNPPVALGELT